MKKAEKMQYENVLSVINSMSNKDHDGSISARKRSKINVSYNDDKPHSTNISSVEAKKLILSHPNLHLRETDCYNIKNHELPGDSKILFLK